MSSTKQCEAACIALVDCNNFFVSCERVFDPRLAKRPVVVLSGLGGIIVARSNEAKALGVAMGAPIFEYRALLERAKGVMLTSNFALYGDMSRRVMRALEFFSPEVEVYSIDEAFLDFSIADKVAEAKKLRKALLQWTGIPVSVGMAATKTLAKAAGREAKSHPDGVFLIDSGNVDALLGQMPVEEIWGVGRRYGARLKAKGIYTAAALRDADDGWIRKHFSVVGLRIAWELRGRPCLLEEELPQPQQTITCSRTFARPIHTLEELNEAFATHTVRSAEKLRQQGQLASCLNLFVLYHPYKSGSESLHIPFPEATAYTPELLGYVRKAVEKLYKEGSVYRKAGVHFEGLVPASSCQGDLFSRSDPKIQEKKRRAMAAVDTLNKTFGGGAVKIAAEGLEQPWRHGCEQRSPRYTSCWDELPTVS